MSTPICFNFLISLFACKISRANLENASSSFVKWSIIGPINTGWFFLSTFTSRLLRYVVPVTNKSHKLKVVSTAKVVALISVQQNCVMSFICHDWYKKAKYAGLLADIVLRKSQFCCNVNRLISSSLFLSSPLVSVDCFRTLLRLFCTCFKLRGSWDWLTDVNGFDCLNWTSYISVAVLPNSARSFFKLIWRIGINNTEVWLIIRLIYLFGSNN